jgi:ribosomal-protein-alanine N-acetyltransferase
MDSSNPRLTDRVYTDRLVLEQPQSLDEKDVLAFYIANKVFHAPWEPVRPSEFYQEDSMRKLLASQAADNAEGRALHLYLQLPQEPGIIGSISLSNIIYGPFLSCFLGYRIARCMTCHGYMGEAVEKVISLAFGHFGLHRIEANIMPGNHASVRLVEKLGFINEGFSSRYLKIAGVWEGHSHYVLFNEALE